MSKPKIHYKDFDIYIIGDPCGCPTATWAVNSCNSPSTKDKKKVTCKYCLKSLKTGRLMYIASGRDCANNDYPAKIKIKDYPKPKFQRRKP